MTNMTGRWAAAAAALSACFWAAGCSTTAVIEAPYGNVIQAVRATFPQGQYEVKQDETAVGERSVFEVQTRPDPFGMLQSLIRTSLDVQRLDDERTTISVCSLRQGFVTADRDEQKEKQVLDMIRRRAVGLPPGPFDEEGMGEFWP